MKKKMGKKFGHLTKIHERPVSMWQRAHCPSSRKRKIKPQWHTPVYTSKWLKLNNDNSKYWQEQEATRTVMHHWWECKMGHPLWRKVCHLSHDTHSSQQFYSHVLPKRKENAHTDLLITLFIKAPNGNTIFTVEYYLATKGNKLHATT